jgi:GWxTD domain-containing protein
MLLRYLAGTTLTFILLLSGFSSVNSFSKKGLTQEQKKILSYLEKVDATKTELDTISILFKFNTPPKEIQKRIDFITQRKLSQLTLEQQRVYYSLKEEERSDYLIASDKDGWLKKRDNRAVDKLCSTKEGKIQYYALKGLLTENEITDYIRQDSTGRIAWLKRYWAFKDPNSTTPTNEWEEEFNRRVEFALASFHSSFGVKPWDDRGDAYIKLGEPEERELSVDKSWKTELIEGRRGPVYYTENEAYKSAGETWHYYIKGEKVVFQFEDMKFIGYYQFVPHKSENPIENLDYLCNFNVKKAKLGMAKAVYHYDYGGKSLDFAWEIIKFRSLNNIYEVLLNIGIPTYKLERDSARLVRYNQQIAIRDERGEIVERDSINVCQQVSDLKNQLLIDQKRFLLTPGMYQVIVEIRDMKSKKIGLYNEDIFLPGYITPASLTQPPLEVSRAILSSVVREAQPDEMESKFFLNGYLVVPNPGHIFLFEQEPEIKAYFEIYNLLPKDDTLRFATISQVIKYVSTDSAVVSSDTTVTIHSGFVPGTYAYQILHLINNSGSYLEPGDYLWRIDVVDLNAPYKAESIVDKLRISKGQTKGVLSKK